MGNERKMVLALDDEQAILSAVAANLSSAYGIICVTDSPQLWIEVNARKIDLVLLDLKLAQGDVNGESLIDKLVALNIKVVVLSGKNDVASIEYCKNYGASGFVVKGPEVLHLIPVVRTVLKGGTSFGVAVVDHAVASFAIYVSDLTKAEKPVFDLYHRGMSCKDIALALTRSPKTVDSHCANIRAKFRVTSRQELIKNAIQCGYLNAESIIASVDDDEPD